MKSSTKKFFKITTVVAIVLGVFLLSDSIFLQGRILTKRLLPAYDETKIVKTRKKLLPAYDETKKIYGKELIQYQLSQINDPGEEWDIGLNVGDVYKLSDNDFLRLDGIEQGVAQLTAWNRNDNGCRLAGGESYLKDSDNHEQYTFYVNWLIKLETINSNSISLKIYTGNSAYNECISSPVQYHRCLSFHSLGKFKIQSSNFARYFDDESYYEFNNLMLNYTETAFSKLKLSFPSLVSSDPYGERWNFISLVISEVKADTAWEDTAVVQVTTDGNIAHQLLTDNELREEYANKIKVGDLDFYSTEIHEWTHLFLFSTELLRTGNPDTSKLSEGIADYIQAFVKYYPFGADPKKNICGENHFNNLNQGSILDDMSYVDAFNQGFSYDAGYCFFKQVENICGLKAIDKMFGELLTYQYEPFTNHVNLFGILRDNCSDQNSYDQIMSNFGFSLDLLQEEFQQGSSIPIKEMACID